MTLLGLPVQEGGCVALWNVADKEISVEAPKSFNNENDSQMALSASTSNC